MTDSTIVQINTLAQQEILELPKLYGPGGTNGPDGPPTGLISALELLETTTGVDPTHLTGNQTVASIEAQTLTDLQTLSTGTEGEIHIASIGAISENFIQLFAFSYKPSFETGTTGVTQDAAAFNAGGKPPYTVVQPPPPPANGAEQYLVTNMTTGVSDWENGSLYNGPVAGVTNEFATISPDNLNIISNKLGNFIHTGAGNDAINVSLTSFTKGDPTAVNVLDGGGGSNFLTGNATGTNQFYLDDRNPVSDTVSTIVNMHAGDSVTIFGVNKNDFQVAIADNRGALGYTGVEIGLITPAKPAASVILTGYTAADVSAGKLTVSYGTTADLPGLPGSQYMEIVAAPGTYPIGYI